MKFSKLLLVIISILLSYNINAQVTVLKYENSNTCSGTAANTGRSFSVFGGTSAIAAASQSWGGDMYSYVWADNWGSGSGTKGFKIMVNTVPYNNLQVSFTQMTDDYNGTNVGPRDFKLQYSTDDATYIDVPGGIFTLTGGTGFDNCTNISNLALPATCNNKSAVYLRWIMTSNTGAQGKVITASGQNKLANLIIKGTEMQVAPTNINLTNSTIVPYTPVASTVGNLSAVDINTGNTHTFTLAAGTGDTHNGSFTITGTALKVNALLAPGTYSIRVNVNDGTFDFAKQFSISVPGHAPTDITLSNNAVAPSPAIGTTIGTLTATDADIYDTFTYTLTAGTGSTNNGLFTIAGNELKTNASLAEGTYSVRINVNDGTENYSEAFTITCAIIYPAISGDNSYDFITNVTLNSINRNSAKDAGGYGNYTAVSTTLNKNETYTLYVTNGADIYSGYPQVIKAWFDWNANGSFDDDGEEYTVNGNVTVQGTYNTNITVPASAVEAETRLRVAVRGADSENVLVSPPNKGSIGYGEAEDYTLDIAAPLPVELTEFNASADNGKVKLTWKTATEINNYGFEVERSVAPKAFGEIPIGNKDINEWEKVGFVQGSGNSNSPKQYSFVDTVASDGNVQYRLKQIDLDGGFRYYHNVAEVNYLTDVNGRNKGVPTEFALDQNYPNPFNPTTKIQYAVGNGSVGKSKGSEQLVTLKVYDILGNEVATLVNEHKAPGYYEVEFNGINLSTGVYIYRISAGEFTAAKKLILMK